MRRAAIATLLTAALSGCAASTPRPSPALAPLQDSAIALANRLGNPAQPYREGWSGTGDDRIHYAIAGKGPVMVFVHGFPSFWYSWFDQMEAFKACRTVIAIDAPGAGLSAQPAATEGYRIERLIARLDRLLAELGKGRKVTLVGHDWGGALAWSYAEAHPRRLDRLAVFSAPPLDLFLELVGQDQEQQARSQYMQRFRALDRAKVEAAGLPEVMGKLAYQPLVERGVLSPEEGEAFKRALALPGALDAGMAWYRANIPAFAEIGQVRPGPPTPVPTLLVWGEKDTTFVPRMLQLAPQHATALKIVRLPGVGHWTPFEDPAAANAALSDFLGERCG